MQDARLAQRGFLTLTGVSKRYAGVRALEDVDFACERGKIHAVLGENGAGKSTLIKIMAGVVQPDAGTMCLAGNNVSFPTPSAANAAGAHSPPACQRRSLNVRRAGSPWPGTTRP